jgi:hypothetical protein
MPLRRSRNHKFASLLQYASLSNTPGCA